MLHNDYLHEKKKNRKHILREIIQKVEFHYYCFLKDQILPIFYKM